MKISNSVLAQLDVNLSSDFSRQPRRDLVDVKIVKGIIRLLVRQPFSRQFLA